MGSDSGSRSPTRWRLGAGHGSADDLVAAGIVLGCGYVLLLLWVGAWVSSVLSGHPSPPLSLLAPVQAVGRVLDPSAAWGQPVSPAWLYWSLVVVVLSLGLGLPVL